MHGCDEPHISQSQNKSSGAANAAPAVATAAQPEMRSYYGQNCPVFFRQLNCVTNCGETGLLVPGKFTVTSVASGVIVPLVGSAKTTQTIQAMPWVPSSFGCISWTMPWEARLSMSTVLLRIGVPSLFFPLVWTNGARIC